MPTQSASPAVDAILERLDGVKPLGDGWHALCPAHEDKERSLKIDVDESGKVLLHCHAGCSAEDVVTAIGLTLADLFPLRKRGRDVKASNGHAPKKIAETKYAGHDAETGNLIGYHVRHDFDDGSKRMWWQKPDGTNGLDGYSLERLALYGIDRIGKAQAVVVVEGEKACDALYARKIAAVGTQTGASGTPCETAWEPLIGRHLVIWPDNDDAGTKHADRNAAALDALGHPRDCLQRFEWPEAPPKGDAADWTGTTDELKEALTEAPSWPFSSNGKHDPGGRKADDPLPRFNAGRDDFAALSPLVWTALVTANEPPVMFGFHGTPVRLDRDAGRIIPKTLDDARLGHELARAARWYKIVKVDGERVEVDSSPKLALVKDLLAARSFPFPLLERIVSCPIFGADGSLQTQPGYHEASQTYYDSDLPIGTIPERPTDSEVSTALDWLLAELLADFPFVEESDGAHAFGELVLPFVRAMIAGPCPLHVHEAPTQGTGKDLLAEVMCRVATGADPATLTYSERSEEFGKRLVSTLRPMPEWIVIPNVSGKVENDDLTDLISRGEHQGRLLGVSEMLRLPARNVWTLTSNNAQLTPDMVRRAVRIRIDAHMERPELRTTFRHPELKDWTIEHRTELVRACLTVVQSWIVAGMPAGTETLGGFSRWAKIVGGIVTHAGFSGFLSDREDFIEQADTGSATERAFVALWWERHGPSPTGVGGLYPLAIDENVNLEIEAPTPQGARVKLGMRLRRMRDRRYRIDTNRVVTVGDVGTAQRGMLWKLTEDSPGDSHV